MKFPTCAFRSFTRSSKASFLLCSWRKKEMATSKQSPDESYYDSSSCQSSSSIDVLFRSFSSKKEDANVKNLVVPEISGYYDHDGTGNRFIHQRLSSDNNDDIDIFMLSSLSTTPSKLITNKTAVSLPPSAKKRSASFSLPLEKKKHIHDYAFVSGKQYLGLSTLVLLLLAFTNVSHIAEAKGEVDALHQSNHNEKMGTCARRSLVDFEYFVHRRQQDDLFKLRADSTVTATASSSLLSLSSLLSSSSSVPLDETKRETRPQHEQEDEQDDHDHEYEQSLASQSNHTVFYYYPSPIYHHPSSSSVFLQLHDQFQQFYNITRTMSQIQNRTLPQHVLLSLPYHYDVTKSTEENYAASITTSSPSIEQQHPQNHLEFYGLYKDIRSTLDYNYHSNYIPSRQILQDEIIHYILRKNNGCHQATTSPTTTTTTQTSSTTTTTTTTTSNQGNGSATTTISPNKNIPSSSAPSPWIVFTAGAMGAGKSYTMRHLHNTNRFPLSNFITIDPDEVRNLLPEYQYYIQNQTSLSSMSSSNSNSLIENAGAYTKKESGYICEIILQVALRNGCNVLMDGSLRDHQWYLKHFQSLRYQFQYQDGQISSSNSNDNDNSNSNSKSGINIGIIHIQAPKEAILQRARLRSKITRRIVPTHVLEESVEMVPKSVAILSKHADFFVELYNGPDASDIEITTEGVTWDTLRSVFYDHSHDDDDDTPTVAVAAVGNSSGSLSSTQAAHVVVKTTNETKVSSLSSSSLSSSSSFSDSSMSPSKVPLPGMKVDKELDYQLLRLLSKL